MQRVLGRMDLLPSECDAQEVAELGERAAALTYSPALVRRHGRREAGDSFLELGRQADRGASACDASATSSDPFALAVASPRP